MTTACGFCGALSGTGDKHCSVCGMLLSLNWGASAAAAAPVPSGSATRSDSTEMLENIQSEMVQASESAKAAFRHAQALELKESGKSFLRKKDYTAAIAAYAEAEKLGHPWAKGALERLHAACSK